MRNLHIALDVEGVLADSHAATAERSDMLEPKDCPPPNWDFPSDEHHDEFMHVSQNLWHNHAHHIPPMEDGLWKATRRLSRQHDVDIVTHRTGVDRQVQEWLSGYNIRYNEFNSTTRPKSHLDDYDVHIDDSPNVVADALEANRSVILIDRPYNQDIQVGKRHGPFIRRVSSVTEAAEVLCGPGIPMEVNTL
jgi:hypothetical protein